MSPTVVGADALTCPVCGGQPRRITRKAGIAYLACGHWPAGDPAASVYTDPPRATASSATGPTVPAWTGRACSAGAACSVRATRFVDGWDDGNPCQPTLDGIVPEAERL